MTSRKDSRAKPFQRSMLTQIREYKFSETVGTDAPTNRRDGFDVSNYLALEIAVHPFDPDITTITAGANVTLRLWRWKEAANEGTGQGSGQWYCDNDWTVPLDGDGSAGAMTKIYNVQNSERVALQVISVTDPGAEDPEFIVAAYQIGPDYADPDAGFFESVSTAAAGASGGTQDVNLVEVLGTATAVDAGASDAGTQRIIWADDSPGIGEHDVATDDPGFRILGVATDTDLTNVADGDDVHAAMTLDGRFIIASYNRLSDVLNVEVSNPINLYMAWDLIEESSMGTAGSPYAYYFELDSYYRMAVQTAHTLGSGVSISTTFHGTVEKDDPDFTARTYIDVTAAWTGAASITGSAWLRDTDGFWGNATSAKIETAVVNGDDDSAVRFDVKRFVGG